MCAAIAYTKPFSGYSPEVGFTRGGAIKYYITDQHVVFCSEAAVGRRVNDYLSTGETLAYIVVCITLDLNSYALCQPSTQTLACGAI